MAALQQQNAAARRWNVTGTGPQPLHQGAAVPLVLVGVSLAYLWAFGSLYVQIPGLWGNQGVLPVDAVLHRDAPRLAS